MKKQKPALPGATVPDSPLEQPERLPPTPQPRPPRTTRGWRDGPYQCSGALP